MTISAPVITNDDISFSLSGVDTGIVSSYLFFEADVQGISGDDPTTMPLYDENYLPMDVLVENTGEFKIANPAYIAGELTIFLEDAAGWDRLDFDLEDVKKVGGIGFPSQLETASEKQPTPLADSNDIKGAPKYYKNFTEFLYLPNEHMRPNMTAIVHDRESNTIKQFVLDRNGVDVGNGTFAPMDFDSIPSVPVPMVKEDIENVRSYQRYWTLLSESSAVKPVGGLITYYAPDYEEGIPPLYDDLLPGVGESFPAGLGFPASATYDKPREFCGVWTFDVPSAQFVPSDAPTSGFFPERQVSRVRKSGDKWKIESADGISFTRWRRIGAFDADSVTQNRYIRRVTHISDPTGTFTNNDPKGAPKPSTYNKDVRNRYGIYYDTFNTANTSELTYNDAPPEKRVNYAGLSTDEQAFYDALIADGVGAGDIDIDGIWEVTCIKDKYNRLESEYSEARYIPNNGQLVRYSVNSTPNINDIDEVDWEANGWVSEFNTQTHNYKAERSNTGQDFIITQIVAEIGTYTSTVFKAYPNNYFDELSNASTRENYSPQGLNAGINSNDDVDENFTWNDGTGTVKAPNNGAWVDSVFVAPNGWQVWKAEAVVFFGGDELKTPWGVPILYDANAAVVDAIEGVEDFRSTTVTDNGGIETTVYDPATLNFTASLYQFANSDSDSGQQYLINDDLNEDIRYKWEIIFNDGSPSVGDPIFDSTSTVTTALIVAGDLNGSGEATYSPGGTNTYGVTNYGRTLVIYPAGISKRAVFKLTQERTLPNGNVLYTEETRGVFDIADGISPKEVIATSDKPFFTLKGNTIASGGVFDATDYVDPNGADHPEIVLRAFLQNVEEAPGRWYRWDSGELFDNVREDSFSGGTKENTISATYWEELSSAEEYSVKADDPEWNDDTVNKTEIYKYQTGVYYDILRISRIQTGNDAKLIKLISSAQLISYNGGDTDYDPASQVLSFSAQLENLPTSDVVWNVESPAGADLSGTVELYDAASGGNLITQGAATSTQTVYIRTSDYPGPDPAANFVAFRDALHFKIKVAADGYSSLVDYTTIHKNATAGPQGDDSLAIFLDNEADIVPVDESGIPIDGSFSPINGSLSVISNIGVFQGATDVSGSYEIDTSGDLTAVDENGDPVTKGSGTSQFDYTISSGKVTVIRIPEDKTKLLINIPIKLSGGSVVGTKVLTVSKSFSGINGLNVSIDNELETVNVSPTSAVIGGSASGLTGYVKVAEINSQILVGSTALPLVFNGDDNDTIVQYAGMTTPTGFATAWPDPGALGETTARSINITTGGNDYYFVQGDSGKIHIISREESTGSAFTFNIAYQHNNQLIAKTFKLKYLVQSEFYQVILESNDPSFHGNDTGASFVEIDAYIIDIEGVKQDPIPTGLSLEWNIGTSQTPDSGYIGKRKVTKTDINLSNLVTATLKRGTDVLSQGSITVYDLKDAATFQTLYYQTDDITVPSKPVNLDYSTYPPSSDGDWGQTENNTRQFLWSSRKSEFDDSWSYPAQVRGETGKQGDLIFPIYVYLASDTKPIATGGTLPTGQDETSWGAPAGWSKSAPLANELRLWVASRSIKVGQDTLGNNTYAFEGDWVVSLLGGSDTRKVVTVYRGSSTANPSWIDDRDSAAGLEPQYPQSGSSAWKNSLAETNSSDYSFSVQGVVVNGILIERTLEAGLIEIQLNASSRSSITNGYVFKDDEGSVITTGNLDDAYIYNGSLYLKKNTSTHRWVKNNSKLFYWTEPATAKAQGNKGDKGDKGDKGNTGNTGATGATGPQGPAGADGSSKMWSRGSSSSTTSVDTGVTSTRRVCIEAFGVSNEYPEQNVAIYLESSFNNSSWTTRNWLTASNGTLSGPSFVGGTVLASYETSERYFRVRLSGSVAPRSVIRVTETQ